MATYLLDRRSGMLDAILTMIDTFTCRAGVDYESKIDFSYSFTYQSVFIFSFQNLNVFLNTSPNK